MNDKIEIPLCKQPPLVFDRTAPPNRGENLLPDRGAPRWNRGEGLQKSLYSITTTYGSQRKISKYSSKSPQTCVSPVNHTFDILSNIQTPSCHGLNTRITASNPSDKLQRDHGICCNIWIGICSNWNTKKSIRTK